MPASERITSLLEHAARNGWKYETEQIHASADLAGPVPAASGYKITKEGETFSLVFAQNWVYVQSEVLPPVMEKDPLPRYRQFMHLQNQFFMAKFSIFPQGGLALRVDLPEYQQNLTQFVQSLDAILYCQKEYRQARIGSRSPKGSLPAAPGVKLPYEKPQGHWMSDDQVRVYFKRLSKNGWQVADEKPDAHTFVASYFSQEKTHHIYFSLTAGWAYFQAPLATTAYDPLSILPIYLMELNDQIYWAKFSLLEVRFSKGLYDQVILTLDMPSDALDFSLFKQAALTVSHYLDAYYYDLALLTKDHGLAQLAARRPYTGRQAALLPKEVVWQS